MKIKVISETNHSAMIVIHVNGNSFTRHCKKVKGGFQGRVLDHEKGYWTYAMRLYEKP